MKGSRKVYGWTTTLMVLAIVLVANAVSTNFFTRLDLSEGRIFSLYPASKRVVGELDDTFLVKAYFSKNLPAPYNTNARFVQDKLEEYRAFGKGRFRFEFVDPSDDAELEQEAQKHQIPPVQVQVVEHDQFQSKRAYMGLVFLYRDRQEAIPVVDDPLGLEYEITSTIKKLTSESADLPIIGFLTGHQEPGLSELQIVQQVFQKHYQIRSVDVSNGQRVADDVAVLIIASPRTDLTEWERYAVDQYIMKGGKVAFLIDKVNADLQAQRATTIPLQMDEWFANYGVAVQNNLVGDLVNPGILSIEQRQGAFRMLSQVPFPFIAAFREFNRTNVMVKDIERASLYFASVVDTSLARARGLDVEPLFFSSEKTSIQEGVFNINPTERWTPEQFDRGPQVMAAVVSGSFASYFKDKDVPAANDTTEAVPSLEDTTLAASPESRLVVIGDGEFFVDSKGGNDRDNLLLFQNMVDWLAQDEDLITIRSRDVTDRTLRPISPTARRAVKIATIVGNPLLVVVVGIAIWQMRRRRKVEV